mmetsp:Transcript_14834/g.41995  ORF Transcript_14834/g.41995 Transcript_14834/m.41995 type:complete len:269 (+) Transcript_14834:516-1322(+)
MSTPRACHAGHEALLAKQRAGDPRHVLGGAVLDRHGQGPSRAGVGAQRGGVAGHVGDERRALLLEAMQQDVPNDVVAERVSAEQDAFGQEVLHEAIHNLARPTLQDPLQHAAAESMPRHPARAAGAAGDDLLNDEAAHVLAHQSYGVLHDEIRIPALHRLPHIAPQLADEHAPLLVGLCRGHRCLHAPAAVSTPRQRPHIPPDCIMGVRRTLGRLQVALLLNVLASEACHVAVVIALFDVGQHAAAGAAAGAGLCKLHLRCFGYLDLL